MKAHIAMLACVVRVTSAPAGELPPDLMSFFQPPSEFVGDTSGYGTILRFDDGRSVDTPADWSGRRAEILDNWHSLMGRWPDPVENFETEILETKTREDFIQQKLRFRWSPNEKTTGYLLLPKGPGPHPAVVTVFYEPETAIGLGRPDRDFALQLVRRGFVALSLGTSETTAAKTYSIYWPNRERAEVQPLSMLACATANAWRMLSARPEVDEKRIGIVGHSYGGKWAMFASCLFEGFACAAWSDPGIVFDDNRPSVNYHEPWYLGYEPPPWRKRGPISASNPATGLYPRLRASGRDLHELHALMAPRPFLVSGGSEDSPRRWRALNRTREVYDLLGVPGRIGMSNRPEHSPNAESNEVIARFFEHFLGSAR
ncbi:MAG: sialidase [Verrucomicrobiae bacterium]|nr:sialidase [Verrucomicrobiae bacterium]